MENDWDRRDNRKCLERMKHLTLLASNYLYSLNVSNQWNGPYNHWHGMDKGKGPCNNCAVKNTTLQIARILMTRTRSRNPKRSAQLVGSVVDVVVGTVANAKVTTRSGARAMIISMGI